MPPLYWLAVTVHVLAALLWLGGTFFLGIVGAPVLRTVEPASLRQQLFQQLGVRFRLVGWIAIAMLVGTGVLLLDYRGWLVWQGILDSPTFWSTGPGSTLAWKLTAVVTMLVIQCVHDFVHGPAAATVAADSAEGQRLRRRAARLARVNALVGVVLVIAAVRLARGG